MSLLVLAPTTPSALDTDQAKTIGIVAIIVLVLLGAVISALITAILGRIITIVVVLGLALFVYTQRADIEAAAKRCDASFMGVHLTPSDPQLRQRCANLSK